MSPLESQHDLQFQATAILDAPYDCVTLFHQHDETFHETFTNPQPLKHGCELDMAMFDNSVLLKESN